MSQTLFDQLSEQQNFLLLSQRQMILVSAFGVGIATFGHNIKSNGTIKKIYLAYLSLMLLGYAIATGIKASIDFNDYISDVKEEKPSLDKNELSLVNRTKTWVYFSYVLIAVTVTLLIMFFKLRSFL